MKTAQRFALCLCALPWLAACGATRAPLVRTEVVEVPVTAYAELPPALTAPLAEPAVPPLNCKLRSGLLVPCAYDALMSIVDWREVVQQADADRASAAKISQPHADPQGLEAGQSHPLGQAGSKVSAGSKPR